MARIGRNERCPCGSGEKYKLCCLGKDDSTFSVKAVNPPEAITSHLVSNDGGKTWEKRPGLLAMVDVVEEPEHSAPEVRETISSMSKALGEEGVRRARATLHECEHKLKAVNHHLRVIESEITGQVAQYERQHKPGAGAATQSLNPTLIYETEAFLFQVKSSLDVLTRLIGRFFPRAGSLRSFRHKGEPGSATYVAGGKVLDALKKEGAESLCHLLDGHRNRWIQELCVARDTVTHESGLKGFQCFVTEPYLGKEMVKIHYPAMPSGERLDLYAKRILRELLNLHVEVARAAARLP